MGGDAQVLVDVSHREFKKSMTPDATVFATVLLEVAQFEGDPPHPTFRDIDVLRFVENVLEYRATCGLPG
jgi:hypothetical protein